MPDQVLTLALVVGFVVLAYEFQDELFDDDLTHEETKKVIEVEEYR